MKAWLVTWEWTGNHVKEKNEIAAILSSRLSGKRVREIVEQIYVNAKYTLRERASYANNKKFNPYPAQYGTIKGIDYLGEVYCGHNPYLYARRVNNLKVDGTNSEEEISWQEQPKPKPKI